MSKILMHTLGSSGDFNPVIALAYELRERGHDVHFAVSPARAAALEAHGFLATAVGPDPEPDSDLMRRLLMTSLFKPVEILFREVLIPGMLPAYDAMLPLVQDSDLFLAHSIQLAAPALAFHTGVPWVSLMPPTACYPTGEYPPPAMAIKGFPTALSRLSWRVAGKLLRPIDALANEEYRKLGAPPREDIVLGGSYSRQLTLGLWSPAYYPKPTDWPDWFQVGGYARWDGFPEEQNTHALDLPEGDGPLIVFTLGSSVVNHPGAFFETAVKSLGPTPWRAVLLGAPQDLAIPNEMQNRVKTLAFAPYASLFPFVDAIVHQGGVGTTQAACYYGKPALVVPRGFDQFENAAHIQRNEWGLRLLPADLSPTLLRLRLERLLGSRSIKSHVSELGTQMRAESGPKLSADILEALLQKSNRVYSNRQNDVNGF